MKLVFLLEEPSIKEMLKGLLPRLVPDITDITYIVFEGKSDLENNIVRRLRKWRHPASAFVVVRDQDSSDCIGLKEALVRKCHQAGRGDTVVRIACRELESWYFGDLAAVERGLGVADLVRYGKKSRYRIPDDIQVPSRELMKITRNAYQKVSGSRAIGPYMRLDMNRSHSFRVFLEGVRRAAVP